MNNLYLLAQIENGVEQASAWVQSLPAIVIAIIVFAVLKFVFKASLVVIVVGTIIALVASGLVTISL